MKRVLSLLLLAGLIFSSTTAVAEEVSFTTSVPRVVSEGEEFRITFSVNADVKDNDFIPPDFSEFTVLAGPSRSISQSFQIINGQTSHSKTISYIYILQANKVGKTDLGAASITVDGKTYQTRPASIEVVAADNTGQTSQPVQQGGQAAVSTGEADVFVRIQLSKPSVYRGEHLYATIKIYTQADIAGFEDVKFPTFNGFWSQELEAPQQLNFQRENVNGKIYHAAVLRRYILFPQQTGNLTIEPFEITCAIQTRTRTRSLFDDFFSTPQVTRKKIASPTGTVNVNPLPANAPASFAGAVGTGFTLSASFLRDSLTANEASSLLIKIAGEGNLKLMDAPKITWPPDFETYDVKVTDNSKAGAGGTKQFETPFIPRSAGSFTIPALAFSYFDIAKKQYITLTTRPLELKVGRDPNATGTTAVTGVNRQTVKSLGEDIRYIKTDHPTWRKKGKVFLGSPIYYLIISVEVLAFFALYIYLRKRRKDLQNVVLVRNRKANKIARRRLTLADRLLKSGNETGFYEELTKALWGYLSDKLAIDMADLSRENIRETLLARQLPDADTASFLQVLDECEFARYAPAGGQGQMQKIYTDAIHTVSQLEQHLK